MTNNEPNVKLPEQFRKKPVVVEAMGPIDHENRLELARWCGGYTHIANCVVIPTLEGDMTAALGDWIIKGVKGEFYPCKPDIFAATYEPVIALNTPSVDADECTCHLSATAWRDCSVKHHAATGVGEQGAVADAIWRIDNEAAQFIDKDGMIYLRYLRDLLANQRPAPTGVYAAKLNELVNKWRGNAKSHEIKADREGQSDDIRNWHQGADQAFGDCANELSAALAALAEKAGR